MARDAINDLDLDNVVGGSIVFNADHTTCGRNCNNQYKVLDYNAMLKYIGENRNNMNEKTMLANMLKAGLITNL